MRHRESNHTGGMVFPMALCLTLFLISGAVVLILNCRWLYYLDIVLLGIEEKASMRVRAIRENYDALIRYNSLFFRGTLTFPTLRMSEEGRIHFQDVKRIFDAAQVLCIVTGIGSVFSLIRMKLSRWYRPLQLAGILSLILPAILGVLAVVWWDRFFITFHKLMFRNDYWLFDPVTDPVIKILPDTYFMHCAIGILLIIFLGGVWMLRHGKRR